MRLFFHIGLEKTGTTSIQDYLASNREALREKGVLYPLTPGVYNSQAGLISYAQTHDMITDIRKMMGLNTSEEIQTYRKAFPKMFMDEARESGCHTMIISSEHGSSRLAQPHEIKRAAELCAKIADEVKIVIYLRKQADYLLSSHSTALKAGASTPLRPIFTPPGRYDYAVVLKRWTPFFGKDNIIVRVFEPESLKEGNIVVDFFDALGLALPAPVTPKRLNRRLERDAVEYLRLANAMIDGLEPENGDVLRREVLNALETFRLGGRAALTEREMDEIEAKFAQSNAEVAREFLGLPEGAPLFNSPRPKAANLAQIGLSPERMMQISMMILRRAMRKRGRG